MAFAAAMVPFACAHLPFSAADFAAPGAFPRAICEHCAFFAPSVHFE